MRSALGDYITGPNHILPTAGAARHTGGLSVHRFLKIVTVQEVAGRRRGRAVQSLAEAAARLAAREGLLAHEESIAIRSGSGRPAAIRSGSGQPAAILFDFNGVLMDDEEYHWCAFREVLAPLGITLSRKRYDRRYLAFDDATALKTMLEDAGRTGARFNALLRRKRRLFRRLCKEHVRIEPPVVRLVRTLARSTPLAIVSGAARAEIVRALRQARIARAFRTIVSCEAVERCKPDPEGYLLGLRRLGIRNRGGSVAVEDSPGGIRAARAAGLRVVAVATSYSPAVLRRAGAIRVARTLGDLTPARILEAAEETVRPERPRAPLRRARRAGRLRGRGRRPKGRSRWRAPGRRRRR